MRTETIEALRKLNIVCRHNIGIHSICRSCETKRCRIILENIFHAAFPKGSHRDIFLENFKVNDRRHHVTPIVFDGINIHLKIVFDYCPKWFYQNPLNSRIRKIKKIKEMRCNKLNIVYIQIPYTEITMEDKFRTIKRELRICEVNVPKILAELARDAQFMKNAKNHN